MKLTRPLALKDEGDLFSFLDEHMNANGIEPRLVGLDSNGTPFIAWLDEEGGDCVGLRVVDLQTNDDSTGSWPSEIDVVGQGRTSSLVYPVTVLERVVLNITNALDGDDI